MHPLTQLLLGFYVIIAVGLVIGLRHEGDSMRSAVATALLWPLIMALFVVGCGIYKGGRLLRMWQ